MVEKTIIQVAAGLIEKDRRYLITKRPAGVHLAGFWEFPGGKRETGESLEQCLLRELKEELGIDITPGSPFHIIRHEYPEKLVELHFFRCTIRRGDESMAVRFSQGPAHTEPPTLADVLDCLASDASSTGRRILDARANSTVDAPKVLAYMTRARS